MTAPTDPSAHHGAGTFCGNCGAALSGPYCAQCGQHAHASARNLGAVVHDLWHDVTHVDGRLWHTLWLLVSRPGYLTVEYFHERRTRYLPPVRLYLVLSVLFFAFGVGHPTTSTPEPPATPTAGTAAKSTTAHPVEGRPDAPQASKRAGPDEDDDADPDASFQGMIENIGSNCDKIHAATPWLTKALKESCARNSHDHGETFLRTLVHNIPKMMFVFLPLVAGVMVLLYWRPRRYYVEHLIFLLHNHSALFLCFVTYALLGRVLPRSGAAASIVSFALVVYVVWYPYKAMRRYYAQGRSLTLSKYFTIALAYLLCLMMTLVGTAVVTALEG